MARQFLLGVAYQAGPDPLIMTGADGERDYFTKEELELAAHSFLRNGPAVGLFHVDGTEGCAYVVENTIHRGPDWVLEDGRVVKDGDWLVGAYLDDTAWALYEKGEITGWSPQGSAKRIRREA